MSQQCTDTDGALITQYSFDDPEDVNNFVYGTYDPDANQQWVWDVRLDVQIPPPTPYVPPVLPPPHITPPVPPRIKVPRPCIPPVPSGP